MHFTTRSKPPDVLKLIQVSIMLKRYLPRASGHLDGGVLAELKQCDPAAAAAAAVQLLPCGLKFCQEHGP